MARMTAAEAAVLVMEREGVHTAFGVPGAAINPLYAALRRRDSITHILARHVEAASHMAEGYTRARAGNIGQVFFRPRSKLFMRMFHKRRIVL